MIRFLEHTVLKISLYSYLQLGTVTIPTLYNFGELTSMASITHTTKKLLPILSCDLRLAIEYALYYVQFSNIIAQNVVRVPTIQLYNMCKMYIINAVLIARRTCMRIIRMYI